MLDRLFTLDQWEIGYTRTDPESFIRDRDLSPVTWWAGSGRSAFRADPFIMNGDVVYEHLSRWRGRGELRISTIEGARARTFLRLPCHLSFPCVFQDGGRSFLMPESSECGTTTIYRVESTELNPVCELPMALVDPALIRHDGRIWLFATLAGEEANSHLRIWYAEAMEGPWTEHGANPVKIDRAGARNGGKPFRAGSSIYRPAQDCSESYGAALNFYRVSILQPDMYKDSFEFRIEGGDLAGRPAGIHTIDFDGTLAVVDGRRRVFHPLAWMFRLRNKLFGLSFS